MSAHQRQYQYKLLFPLLAIVIGFALVFLFCEIVARILYDPDENKPRVPLVSEQYIAHCYPTDPNDTFPLDLNNPQDLSHFLREMADFAIYDDNLRKAYEEETQAAEKESTIAYLRREAPHCLIYDDTSPSSPRKIIRTEKFDSSVALIGDSFAYGQGVKSEETYGYFLARELQGKIINFSHFGANLPRIVKQFDKALVEDTQSDFSKIIYLFVLDDPLISPELRKRRSYINDLMNYRPYYLKLKAGFLPRICFWFARYSRLFNFVTEKAITYLTTKESISWYRDIFSEKTNSGLIPTFNIIAGMKNDAEENGMSFFLVIYPLMANMKNYPFIDVHRKIRKLAGQRGIRCIDLLPAFQEHAGKNLTVHTIDYHPNALSHQIAAAKTARSLQLYSTP